MLVLARKILLSESKRLFTATKQKEANLVMAKARSSSLVLMQALNPPP